MEKITKLYSVLKRDGFYTKSLDEFLKQFQDPAYQDKVFKVVTRERLFTKSKEEFLNTYSVKKKRRFGISFGRWFFGFVRNY